MSGLTVHNIGVAGVSILTGIVIYFCGTPDDQAWVCQVLVASGYTFAFPYVVLGAMFLFVIGTFTICVLLILLAKCFCLGGAGQYATLVRNVIAAECFGLKAEGGGEIDGDAHA